MSQNPNVVYVKPPSNSMGLAGFIVSLVGWMSCGILCPIGLVLSLVGMRKEPRGFAVAGLILGVLGSIWAIVALFFGGIAMVFACGGAMCAGIAPQIVTQVHMDQTANRVEEFVRDNGRLPTGLDELPTSRHAHRMMRDGWDRPLRFADDGKGGFTISSDGPDGVAGNRDDLKEDRPHTSSGGGRADFPIPDQK